MSKPKFPWLLGWARVWNSTNCVVLQSCLKVETDRTLYKYLTPDEARKLGVDLISAARELELYLEEEKRKAEDQAA